MIFQDKIPQLKNIPANVLKARENAGMSTVDVMKKVGIDPSALRKLERGMMRNPSIATLLALTKAYGCTLDDLIYRVPPGASN